MKNKVNIRCASLLRLSCVTDLLGFAYALPSLRNTQERERDRRIIAVHEWGHFLLDFERKRDFSPTMP